MIGIGIRGVPLAPSAAGSITPPPVPSTPANAITYNGAYVTYNGAYLTYTPA